MTTCDLDLYFSRKCKPKIGTGIQYTTRLCILKIPSFTGKKCTKMGKTGKENRQDRTGMERITEIMMWCKN